MVCTDGGNCTRHRVLIKYKIVYKERSNDYHEVLGNVYPLFGTALLQCHRLVSRFILLRSQRISTKCQQGRRTYWNSQRRHRWRCPGRTGPSRVHVACIGHIIAIDDLEHQENLSTPSKFSDRASPRYHRSILRTGPRICQTTGRGGSHRCPDHTHRCQSRRGQAASARLPRGTIHPHEPRDYLRVDTGHG